MLYHRVCFSRANDVKIKLILKVRAREPEVHTFVEHGEEMEEEVKATMGDLLKTATGGITTDIECRSCKMPAQKTNEVAKLPENVIVAIDRSSTSADVKMGLEGTQIGEKTYKGAVVVHQEKSGHFVSFQQVDGVWWKLRDEVAEQVKDFEVQDNLRGQWVLALLKQT